MVLISSGRIEMSGFLPATGYKFHSIAKTVIHEATEIAYYNRRGTPDARITERKPIARLSKMNFILHYTFSLENTFF